MLPSSSIACLRSISGAAGLAFHDRAEKGRFDVGGLVDAGRHAVADQVEQEGLFAGRRVLQQLHELRGPLRAERLGHDALGGAFLDMAAIGFEHGGTPRWVQRDRRVRIRARVPQIGPAV
jgi:hypothetical protein